MNTYDELYEKYSYLKEWSILSGYRGSISHGTYVPSTDPNSIDDKDLMVICVPPIDYYFGLKEFGSRGTQEIKYKEWDVVVYELKKFIRMLKQGNPNVLGMLWLNQNHYTYISRAGQLLLDNRNLFVGKHVYDSFCGYARGQLKRMIHFKFEGYMGEKRKKLVNKLGFDCRNSSHLIRLLRSGIEFLNTGYLQVYRPDALELIDIKLGKWSLEKVQKEADNLFKEAKKAYDNSSLPVEPDKEAINNLCIDILFMGLIDRRLDGYDSSMSKMSYIDV